MCHNIKHLFNFEPTATHEEVHAAALQYVRKVSGFNKPSTDNEEAFNAAVEDIAHTTEHLLGSLTAHSHPHNREKEAEKAHLRALKRFGKQN
ncbi:MAG TPA: DUF2277 domain-containing protein [Patescibacteria group bacterium]|nr:DUF2277 domain-containing protein [Patescibacteria group bacterium]